MKLKEQTVYIPIGINEASEKTFVTMSKVRGQIHLKQDKLICLSKEELIELLNEWEESQDDSQYLPMGGGSCKKRPTKEQFINQLIDNTKQ